MKMRMFAALLATLLPATVSAASDAPKRLRSAAEAFKEVMGIPDKAIPQELLEKAECIVIIPDLKKGAFIVGGKYGKGFVSCRKKNGVGWSAPGSIRIEGGSVGFQIGASEMDVFMLVMNDRGLRFDLQYEKYHHDTDIGVTAWNQGEKVACALDLQVMHVQADYASRVSHVGDLFARDLERFQRKWQRYITSGLYECQELASWSRLLKDRTGMPFTTTRHA